MGFAPDRDRLRLAAAFGFLAIVLGSLGAHGGVHDRIVATGEVEHWQTAAHYHLTHAIVLLVLALFGRAANGGTGEGAAKPMFTWPWRCFVLGITVFCGSLYLLAYTQQRWLAHVTPFGGVLLMAGWMLLALNRRRGG